MTVSLIVDPEADIAHRNATWWHQAPLPRRLHRCTSWTSGRGIERCACGAIRHMGGRWSYRNDRRHGHQLLKDLRRGRP
jgi:hypothetical protein